MVTTLANMSDEVKYGVTCEVLGTADTRVNLGTAGSSSSPAPICCGSSTLIAGARLAPTGQFRRLAIGGMLSVTGGQNAAKYAPAEVRDLYAGLEQPLYVMPDNATSSNQTFQLYFTAPGGRLDSSSVSSITIYFATNQSLLMSFSDMINQNRLNHLELVDYAPLEQPPLFGQHVRLDVMLLPPAAGGRFILGQQYFFRLHAISSSGAALSNIAQLYLRTATDPDRLIVSGLKVAAIAGIVLIVLIVSAATGMALKNLLAHLKRTNLKLWSLF
jgi:hypothetical protein